MPLIIRLLSLALVVISPNGLVLAADSSFDPGSDPGKNSKNIHLSGTLNPSPEHPYAGFWKTKCSQDFGLAISPAGPSLYSVSFCGPGGCFRPGTYRPNTTLVSDPNYRVESSSAIVVRGMGDSLTRYERCWPSK